MFAYSMTSRGSRASSPGSTSSQPVTSTALPASFQLSRYVFVSPIRKKWSMEGSTHRSRDSVSSFCGHEREWPVHSTPTVARGVGRLLRRILYHERLPHANSPASSGAAWQKDSHALETSECIAGFPDRTKWSVRLGFITRPPAHGRWAGAQAFLVRLPETLEGWHVCRSVPCAWGTWPAHGQHRASRSSSSGDRPDRTETADGRTRGARVDALVARVIRANLIMRVRVRVGQVG